VVIQGVKVIKLQRKTISIIFISILSVLIVWLVNAQSDTLDLPDLGNVVLPESIYVRSESNRGSTPIGELTAGQFVYPNFINADGTWVFIVFNETFGWVNRDLIRWTDDIDNLPVRHGEDPLPTIDPSILSATPLIPTETRMASFVLNNTANAFIRSGPGRTYNIVGQISFKDSIENPIGRTEDSSWVLFQYEDEEGKQFGWIFASLVEWLVELEGLPVLSEDALTPTVTFTPSNTPTHTNTPTSTFTATDTNTPTSTNTNTPTSTNTNTPTSTSTNTDTPTSTSTDTDVPTSTDTDTPTSTSTDTDTPTSTSTDTNTPTPTSTHTDTPTSTSTNTDTPTSTSTHTDTPTSTHTDTPTSISTNTDTPTSTDTGTPTSTDTDTPTPTSTDTDVPTSTDTDTPTSTSTQTDTPTSTPTSTDTDVPTSTDTDTPTSTSTQTDTPTSTSTHTDVPTSTSTHTDVPTSTSTNTDVPTSTSTHTDVPTSTSTQTDTPTLEVTEDVTVIAAVANSNQPTPTRLSQIEITEVPPTDDSDPSAGRFPIEAFIGIVLFIMVLLYIALYWNGLSLVDRYTGGFVIENCPVCHTGHLHVESRQERILGIPTVKHTVRCDNCRSILRGTGNRRWRYAVDRVENPDLYERYNGKEIMTGELASLLVQKKSSLGKTTLPKFVDDDLETDV
jgi:hypothetical protein